MQVTALQAATIDDWQLLKGTLLPGVLPPWSHPCSKLFRIPHFQGVMGQFFDSCPDNLFSWIRKQHIFFVATSPLSSTGHVNVSPKGAFDCFHLVDANKIWYEDLTGSGNETISHLRENGRITVMFVAFEGPPRIVRFFGTGELTLQRHRVASHTVFSEVLSMRSDHASTTHTLIKLDASPVPEPW